MTKDKRNINVAIQEDAEDARGRVTTDPIDPVEAAALSRDNPDSRWHEEQRTPSYRHSWACIPLTDAVNAIEAALRASDTPGLREAAHVWVGDHGVATGGNVPLPDTPGLDEKRLANILFRFDIGCEAHGKRTRHQSSDHREDAENIAREYAALSSPEPKTK